MPYLFCALWRYFPIISFLRPSARLYYLFSDSPHLTVWPCLRTWGPFNSNISRWYNTLRAALREMTSKKNNIRGYSSEFLSYLLSDSPQFNRGASFGVLEGCWSPVERLTRLTWSGDIVPWVLLSNNNNYVPRNRIFPPRERLSLLLSESPTFSSSTFFAFSRVSCLMSDL